jgi:hypothetical protein
MSEHALPCIKCGKPLRNVEPDMTDNQPYGGTEFVTYGHYGSTIHDELVAENAPRLALVVNLCDTCILRAIDANVIQSRGENGTPLLAHHHLDDRARAWVLAQNEKAYGCAWGDDVPVDYAEQMRLSGWTLPLDEDTP